MSCQLREESIQYPLPLQSLSNNNLLDMPELFIMHLKSSLVSQREQSPTLKLEWNQDIKLYLNQYQQESQLNQPKGLSKSTNFHPKIHKLLFLLKHPFRIQDQLHLKNKSCLVHNWSPIATRISSSINQQS